MWASIGGHVDVVDLLLRGDSQRGIPPADINAQDTVSQATAWLCCADVILQGGVVALHYACVNGHTAVVRRLLDDERIEADVQDSVSPLLNVALIYDDIARPDWKQRAALDDCEQSWLRCRDCGDAACSSEIAACQHRYQCEHSQIVECQHRH